MTHLRLDSNSTRMIVKDVCRPFQGGDAVVSPGGGLHGVDDPHVEEGEDTERKQTLRNIFNIHLNSAILAAAVSR